MTGLRRISLAVAILATPSMALANGRFPQAQQLVVDPNDKNHIAVEVTYGFIQTWNHGGNWMWTCEDAALYTGNLDPPIALLDDGTLIAGVFDGLSVSSDKGCNYKLADGAGMATCQPTLGGLDGRFVVDVARERLDPTHAIAVSSNGCGGTAFDTRVWQTTDNAATWTQEGMPLPADFLALTSDVAPSKTSTIYLSGFQVVSTSDYRGALARTTDSGATWEVIQIPNSKNSSGPYIAAIDPNDDKTLYVRLDGDKGQLLVSHDGGTNFTKVFTAQGKMLGFALSPDGTKIVLGGETDGVLRANVSDFAFTQVSTIHTRCLTWDGANVYACASEALDGFTIGESLDEGATFNPIHHLACLDGPVGCDAASDIATKCAGPWAAVSQTIQTDTCTSATSSASTTGGGDGDTAPGCCTVAVGAPARGWTALVAAGAFAALTFARRKLSKERSSRG